jgi:nitrogen fixation NifU-like protein
MKIRGGFCFQAQAFAKTAVWPRRSQKQIYRCSRADIRGSKAAQASMNESTLQSALNNPQNLGEMADADAVGTVGSPDCGDMVRMWLKYKEKDGRKVIDKASFQSFGCQTAIAVASLATELIRGKTKEEALQMSAEELSAPLGPLPPMKIHCGQMVEGALKAALEAEQGTAVTPPSASSTAVTGPTLADSLNAAGKTAGKIKIVLQS